MFWRNTLAAGLILAAAGVHAACDWPAWRQFKQAYISDRGRVIDPSDRRQITTSEGQSYALFFALAANDRKTFSQLLAWTQNNLAEGSLSDTLPAWLWGHADNGRWEVLDANSASDADLWMAWTLLEAGRLWRRPDYDALGRRLLALIARDEVVNIPGLGNMLLPGKTGFVKDKRWRLNPSYLPLPLLARLARYGTPWKEMRAPALRLLLETAPEGFSPDWVHWQKGKGWQLQDKPALAGGYDAIRVYMWAGMLSDKDPDKARLLHRFQPMADATAQRGAPPEKADIISGKLTQNGPVGFSAAVLPMLQDNEALYVQRRRVAEMFPGKDAYYSYVLTLFGQGWDQQRFRFTSQGELVPDWGQQCAVSH